MNRSLLNWIFKYELYKDILDKKEEKSNKQFDDMFIEEMEKGSKFSK